MNYIFSVRKIAVVCEQITDSVNIYLYGCVNLLPPEFVVSLCVYVCLCDIKSQFQHKNTLCVRPQ